MSRGRGWRRVRAQVLHRDGYRCRRCGIMGTPRKGFGNSLEAHHRDGDATNNRMSNLKALCRDCHKSVHRADGMPPRVAAMIGEFQG